jgi:mono/diheme cytochrome c family protein
MRVYPWLPLLPLVILLSACGSEEDPTSAIGGSGGGNTPAETPETPPAETPDTPPSDEAPDTPPAEALEAASTHSAEAIAAADAKFAMICAVCHGAEGRADSPFAKSSPVTPKDLSDTAWQDSVDDEYLAKIITEGGAAVGKSALMSGAPDLKDKPEVLAAMVAKIRGFAKE